jgi:hypothetical protein
MSQKNKQKSKKKGSQSQNKINPAVWLLVAGGILVVGAFALLRGRSEPEVNATIETEGAPSLKADVEKIDLGDVKLGEWVTASFELTNVGDGPLRFKEKPYIEVASGC